MHLLAMGLALLLAFGIILVGLQYIFSTAAAARIFGLPLPDAGANTTWWLRLKGVRDITSGLAVLALMTWSTHRALGILLLAEAFIPVGDMSMIVAAKGSYGKAFGMHGVTAAVMVFTSVLLLTGVP
jgi:hypothetical protein